MSVERYEMVVGLEVHVQLRTRTKAFCACSTRYGAPPNVNTCPVCLALPGTLPVLNAEAVAFVESLTDEIEERSWELMKKVEDLGGSVNGEVAEGSRHVAGMARLSYRW